MIIDEKTQEISLGIIKISVYIRRAEFRHKMEGFAIRLLEEIAARDFSSSNKTIAILNSLINFGNIIYEIEPINAQILLNEIGNLKVLIGQIAELSLPDFDKSLDISSVFSKNQDLFKNIKNDKENSNNSKSEDFIDRVDEVSQEIQLVSNQAQNYDYNNPTHRQTSILEIIRQSVDKSIQLKDIIASFPEYSQRTLRYDLQRLCNDGFIERIGQGGPSTYYKLRVI